MVGRIFSAVHAVPIPVEVARFPADPGSFPFDLHPRPVFLQAVGVAPRRFRESDKRFVADYERQTCAFQRALKRDPLANPPASAVGTFALSLLQARTPLDSHFA